MDWLSVYWFWAVARPDIAPLFVNGFHGGRKSCGTGFSWAERSGARGLREPSIVQTHVPPAWQIPSVINSLAIKQELGLDQLVAPFLPPQGRRCCPRGQLVSPVKKVDSKVIVLSRLWWSHGCVKEPVMAG